MKKFSVYILSLVLIISLVPSYSTAFAQNSLDSHKEALVALSIIPENFGDGEITVLDAVRAFLSMTSERFADESAETCMEIALQSEMVKESGTGYDDKACNYDEAVRMAVCVAGYKDIASLRGGYPVGFNAQAANLQILKNVHRNTANSIDSASFIELLYNTITVEYNNFIGFEGSNNLSETDKNITVLSHYRDIYLVKGIVDANSVTSINGDSGLTIDEISIDGNVYKYKGGYQDYVGRRVEAFCKINDDVKELLYLTQDKKCKEMTIYSPDILSVDEDFKSLSYKNEDERMKEVRLSTSMRLFYNGAVKWDYTAETFKPKNGKITLLDNDDDKSYDCVYITDATVMIIDSYDDITNVIFNSYRHSGAKQFVKLDFDSENLINVYRNGEKTTIDELENGDVIRYAESENSGRKLIEIYASSKRIKAKASSTDTDKVMIKNTEYYLCPEYLSALSANDAFAVPIDLVREFEFYIDDLGNVAAVRAVTSGVLYGYALRYFKTEDEKIVIKLLDSKGIWQKLILYEKVYVNSRLYTDEEALDELCQGGSLTPQLIGYSTNQSGEIRNIYKAVNYTGKETNEFFTKKGWSTATYWSSLLSFGTDTYLDSPTVWVVPEIDTFNEEDYYIETASYFKGNKSYEYMAYDLDDFSFSDKIVVKRKAADESWEHNLFGRLMLVETAGVTVNSDNEICTWVSGQVDDYQNYRLLSKNGSLSGVKRGDIIKINFDKDGYVSTGEIVYSEDIGKLYSDSDVLDSRQVILKGFVSKVDADRKLIKVTLPAEKVYKFASTPYVHILNEATGEITTGDLTNISVNDYVVMRNSYGTISHIFIIKE